MGVENDSVEGGDSGQRGLAGSELVEGAASFDTARPHDVTERFVGVTQR